MKELELAADAMLGGLAKWLRLLGLDTIYLPMGARPPRPERVLLTRRSSRPHQDRITGWRRIVTLTANDTPGQLAETIRALGLTWRDLQPFTLCSVCNSRLTAAGPAEVEGLVPAYVLATQKKFSLCSGCGRVYWPGTHHWRMLAVIKDLLAGSE
ncbi:MAG: Mut7-C RNAse domain-containing protein [Thermodesulfobacteriota bacterium]